MLFRPRLQRRKRGFTLLELTIALGITSIALSGLWQLSQTVATSTQSRIASSQALVVASAARNYIMANRTAVLALVPALNNVAEITVTTLKNAGYLPGDFVDKNAYDQSYKVYVKREDGGTAGADTSDNLVTLVITTGGTTITDKAGTSIVSATGAAGGFLFAADNPASPAAATTARGAGDGWSVDLSATGWSTIGATATAGHLALLANILPHGSGTGGSVSSGSATSIDELSDGAANYTRNMLFLGQTADTSMNNAEHKTAIGINAQASPDDWSWYDVAVGHGALEHNGDGAGGSGSTVDVGQGELNVAIGNDALNLNTIGDSNTAIGFEASPKNTTGYLNTAIGYRALYADTSGDWNTAVGANALGNLDGGQNVVGIGYGAGKNIVTGNYTTAIGSGALGDGGTCDPCDSLVAIGAGAMGLSWGTPEGSVAIGYQALRNTGAVYNTAVGYQAMIDNDSGGNNTAVGYQALGSTVAGEQNTAVGSEALANNGASVSSYYPESYNTAVGYHALYALGTTDGGCCNTAVGEGALELGQNMEENIAIGEGAGRNLNYSGENTLLGVDALYHATQATNTVAIGNDVMFNAGTVADAVGIGTYALSRLNDGGSLGNIGIGYYAGTNITGGGGDNIAIGNEALYKAGVSSTAANNIAIGYRALRAATTGSNNVAVGYGALITNTIGQDNVAIGGNALGANDSSNGNTAIGYAALSSATGTGNTAAGVNAGTAETSGIYNTSVGNNALGAVASPAYYTTAIGSDAQRSAGGMGNTSVGQSSLYSASGSYNTALGMDAGRGITTGGQNIAIGHEALYTSGTSNTASNNIAIGYQALRGVTDGSYNVAIGYQAGSAGTAITSGTYNTFIGYQAQSNADNYTNGTAIGNGAVLTASNRVVLGNNSIGAIYAQVTSITGISDARRKRDVEDLPFDTRAFVNALKPRQYRFKTGSDTLRFGFVAQDVEKALPERLRPLVEKETGLALISRDSDKARTYHVSYLEVLAPLVRTLQDIDKADTAQTGELQRQDDELAALEARLDALESGGSPQ